MTFPNRKVISLVAAVFIVLAQFGVVVHAADHPSHDEDGMCVAFQHAEQNKSLSSANAIIITKVIVLSEISSAQTSLVVSSYNSHYLSRGPPAISI